MIDDKTLQSILSLCKFSLTAQEKEHFKEQIGDILSYVETLNQVATKDLDSDLGNALDSMSFREDKAAPGFPPERVVALSPDFQDSFFTVPRIIEEMDEIEGEG